MPSKLFLNICLGLLYCLFRLICQSYRSFPLPVFRHDFDFLNNALLFLRDALTCRHCVCCTRANEKSNAVQSVVIQVKVPLGICLNDKNMVDAHRPCFLCERGREGMKQTALKTRSKTVLDTCVTGVGRPMLAASPGGHTLPVLDTLQCISYSSPAAGNPIPTTA